MLIRHYLEVTFHNNTYEYFSPMEESVYTPEQDIKFRWGWAILILVLIVWMILLDLSGNSLIILKVLFEVVCACLF